MSKVSGYTLTELMIGMSILVLVALSAIEVKRLSYAIQRDALIKSSEQDMYRQFLSNISDNQLCRAALEGLVLSDGVTPIPDTQFQLSADFTPLFEIKKKEIINLSSPIFADASGELRRAEIRLNIERKKSKQGGAESSKTLGLLVKVDSNKKIVDCGNSFSGESYCTALKGRWDSAQQKCVLDERLSCSAAGGSYGKVAGVDQCTSCWNIGAWHNAGGGCVGGTVRPPPLATNFDGSTGTNLFYQYTPDPMQTVTDWRCDTLPACAPLIGARCAPTTSAFDCGVAIINAGTTSTPPTCTTRKVVCQAP